MMTEEFSAAIEVWAEVLHNIVPQDQINACYLSAIQRHDRKPDEKQFPLKVTELLDAWYRIQASQSSVRITDCEFCRLHKVEPATYQPCPFHAVLNGSLRAKGLITCHRCGDTGIDPEHQGACGECKAWLDAGLTPPPRNMG